MTSQPQLTRRGTLLLAASIAVIAANLYYVQSLIATIAHAVHITDTQAQGLITVSQLGFAVGLVLILPISDLMPARRLLTILLVLDCAALIAICLAPDVIVLYIAFAVLGLANTGAQLIIPAAANLASDASRPRVVGTIISGLLTGILLARTVSGIVADLFGWRAMFAVAAVLILAVIPTTAVVLRNAPQLRTSGTYLAALRNTWRLYAAHRLLRMRAAYGAAAFALFSMLWSSIALLLSGSPFHYSESIIGLFGLLGVAGATAANVTGRISRLSRSTLTVTAIAIALLGFILLWSGHAQLGVLIAGILVLDVGVQALHVVNQHAIYTLAPADRSRANSVYMIWYFAGGSLGSLVATALWPVAGWTGVCAAAVVVTLIAAGIWLFGDVLPTRHPAERGAAAAHQPIAS